MKINQIIVNENIDEGENWSKYNHKRVGGMSKKSVSSYRRSHPGSKIQTAVTTKPSKLKKGSKSAKRRASFCARMRGMKKHRTGAKTARDPNSNINKSLRRWHCESIEDLQQLVMIAEQKINEAKNFAQQAAIAINMKKHHKKPKSEGVAEESKGLWANIHAKQKRIKNGSGEHMRKPGSKGAPTAQAFKNSAKTNESISDDQWYIVMRGNLDFHGNYHGKGDDLTGPLSKVEADAEKHKTHPYDTNWTIVPISAIPVAMQKQGIHEHDDRYSPQEVAVKKALKAGLKKMHGSNPNMLQKLIHKIEPDGTVVVVNSAQTTTMNNIKKILALGGGEQFDVVMASPGPGWHSTHPAIVPDEKKEVTENNEGEQSKYLQGAKDIIKGADPHHIARVRNLDPETLQRYVKLVWDKIDSKEYNYRKPDLAEVKDDDEDDGLIGGRYTPEQWAKMIANLKRKAQEQDAKKKQQEQPKDLGESTVELNNILTLSGNNK